MHTQIQYTQIYFFQITIAQNSTLIQHTHIHIQIEIIFGLKKKKNHT